VRAVRREQIRDLGGAGEAEVMQEPGIEAQEPRDPAAQDVPDPAAQNVPDPAAQDPGVRDQDVRDPGVRDPGVRDPGVRELGDLELVAAETAPGLNGGPPAAEEPKTTPAVPPRRTPRKRAPKGSQA
jgi:hypothetical protein